MVVVVVVVFLVCLVLLSEEGLCMCGYVLQGGEVGVVLACCEVYIKVLRTVRHMVRVALGPGGGLASQLAMWSAMSKMCTQQETV